MNSDTTYHFDFSGRWSGGGKAFLNNATFAQKRFPILAGGTNSIPIIARNTPQNLQTLTSRFILAPQNAWPWNPVTLGRNEKSLVLKLRIASEIAARRSMGVMRISSAIPSHISKTRQSPIIHNVLDTGFEEAIVASQDIHIEKAVGRFVHIGDNHSYKNLVQFSRAYRLYRNGGGNVGLFLAGRHVNQSASKRVAAELSGLDKVTVVDQSLSRAECLAAMRLAEAVVLPSKVEASPVTSLEASWANPKLAIADIPANREILNLAPGETQCAFFDPNSSSDIAATLARLPSSGPLPSHSLLNEFEYREEKRIEWGFKLSEWLLSLRA